MLPTVPLVLPKNKIIQVYIHFVSMKNNIVVNLFFTYVIFQKIEHAQLC